MLKFCSGADWLSARNKLILFHIKQYFQYMMMIWKCCDCHITVPLWGESTSHYMWNPLIKWPVKYHCLFKIRDKFSECTMWHFGYWFGVCRQKQLWVFSMKHSGPQFNWKYENINSHRVIFNWTLDFYLHIPLNPTWNWLTHNICGSMRNAYQCLVPYFHKGGTICCWWVLHTCMWWSKVHCDNMLIGWCFVILCM